jgi:hypothetical protein
MTFSRLRRCLPALVLPLALLTSCSAADLLGTPSTQTWVLIDQQNEIGGGIRNTTYLSIDRGGAVNQGEGAYQVYVTDACYYTVPISGNWSGTAVHMTSTGGNCGAGYILTMDGTANGSYGKATSMSGTYRISYSGVFGGAANGTWTAEYSH